MAGACGFGTRILDGAGAPRNALQSELTNGATIIFGPAECSARRLLASDPLLGALRGERHSG